MLVQRLKDNAWRSEPYRRLVASFACEHCGYAGGQQAAHADLGKGGAIKADDRTCWSACATRPGNPGCHWLFGTSGRLGKQRRRDLELRYACQTIARVQRLGSWARFKVAEPLWFQSGWGKLVRPCEGEIEYGRPA